MFFRRRRLREQDLERELRDHLELEAAELSAEGMDSDEARWAARRRLGNPTRIKEDAMAMWSAASFQMLSQDFKYAVRGLGRSPGFVALATASLAVGIGANTAIFSIIDHVMFRP